jgi:hypothetical protein
MGKKKSKEKTTWGYVGKGALHLIKSPYYLGRGIYRLNKKAKQRMNEKAIMEKRESMSPIYQDFNVLKALDGDYNEWINKVHQSDSQIGVVLGARGSGKSAFGMKFLENAYSKLGKKCFALGFKDNDLPSWIRVVDDVSKLGNNSYVLVDEGGILFSSRSSMSNANKLLSELILIARHKNLTLLFISQNSSNLEVNAIRQADFLVLKPSSLLQKEFERKIIQKLYKESETHFKKLGKDPGLAYIYAGNFRGFISNQLPSFWKPSIGKAFK